MSVSIPLGEFRLERYTRLSDQQLQERMERILHEQSLDLPSVMPDFLHDAVAARRIGRLACRYFQAGLFAPQAQVMGYCSCDASAPRDQEPLWIVAIRCPGDDIFNESFGRVCTEWEMTRAICEVAAMVRDVWAWRVAHDPRYERPTVRMDVRSTYLLQK